MCNPCRTLMLALALPLAAAAHAAEVRVPADAVLQDVIDAASSGDVLQLAAARYHGPVVIAKPLVLQGNVGTVIAGSGQGSVIRVEAPGVTLRGLRVVGSGRDLQAMDAGVFLTEAARGAQVIGNHMSGNLYGVQVHGAIDARVVDNRIDGLRKGRTNQFGNGVSVWNAPGARIEGNHIRWGRDGIFANSSRDNVFRNNVFRDLRFAVHYMYTNNSTVAGNISRNNHVGYAIMFSNDLRVEDNLSDGDRDSGLLLNAANRSVISGNRVIGRPQPVSRWTGNNARTAGNSHGASAETDAGAAATDQRIGPEKCVFLYNANHNRFVGNSFTGCAIGIHFTAGAEGNTMAGNAFIGNRGQVKYVGTRSLDWSSDGRGNYWSDNPGFDLDGDGIADRPYRPNDLTDRLLWRAPAAKVLLNSPAIHILRWAQAHFPALFPGGVVDSYPLMRWSDTN